MYRLPRRELGHVVPNAAGGRNHQQRVDDVTGPSLRLIESRPVWRHHRPLFVSKRHVRVPWGRCWCRHRIGERHPGQGARAPKLPIRERKETDFRLTPSRVEFSQGAPLLPRASRRRNSLQDYRSKADVFGNDCGRILAQANRSLWRCKFSRWCGWANKLCHHFSAGCRRPISLQSCLAKQAKNA